MCLLLRCQLHSESTIDGRSRECGGRRSRALSQNSRRFLVIPESDQFLVTGHSQWPGMQTHAFTKTHSYKPLNAPMKYLAVDSNQLHVSRTAWGRVRSRLSLCLNWTCGRLSSTAAPRNPNVSMGRWTCHALRQTWGTLTSETSDGTLTLSWRKSCERRAGWEGRCCHWDASHTAAVLCDCQANGRLRCNKNPGHISCQCPLPSWEKK